MFSCINNQQLFQIKSSLSPAIIYQPECGMVSLISRGSGLCHLEPAPINTPANSFSFIAIQVCFYSFWQFLDSPHPTCEGVKQTTEGDQRWGEKEERMCLLAQSSLASQPLASCQLSCPAPSLNPQRQTGCQLGEAANMPHRTNTPTANSCSVFIYPFAVCLYLKYKGEVNKWTRGGF